MTAEDEYSGRKVTCVNCRRVLRVPEKPLDPTQPVRAAVVEEAFAGSEPPGEGPGADASPQIPSGGYSAGTHAWLKPHRGKLILWLGIGSIAAAILCCCCSLLSLIPGITAVVMGAVDLQEMGKGRMDPSGRANTVAGIVCGSVGCLMALGITSLGAMPWFFPGSDGFPFSELKHL